MAKVFRFTIPPTGILLGFGAVFHGHVVDFEAIDDRLEVGGVTLSGRLSALLGCVFPHQATVVTVHGQAVPFRSAEGDRSMFSACTSKENGQSTGRKMDQSPVLGYQFRFAGLFGRCGWGPKGWWAGDIEPPDASVF